MPLDHVRCAELHNNIVRIGWKATGRRLENGPFQPFWTAWEAVHEELGAILHADTIAFYKSALVPNGHTELDNDYQNFFYFCSGLANPVAEFNWNATRALNNNQGGRYIVLYSLSDMESGHRVGVLLDQETGKAIMQPDLFSYDSSSLGLPWKPLADVLQSFIDMINVNKVVAGGYKSMRTISPFGMASPQYPWKLVSFSPGIVDLTIEAYRGLIKAIEDRMPPEEEEEAHLAQPLATNGILDRGEFPPKCFVRSFLTSAQRPRRVQYIAPGVALPTEETMVSQPFKELARKHPHASPSYGMPVADDENPLHPPYLLFPAERDGHPVHTTLPTGTDDEPTFQYPFNSLHNLPSGLYLDTTRPWSAAAHEDASLLLLPYHVGGTGGHAQYNEHVMFKSPSKTNLYQTKVNPFIPGHRTQLHLILDSWRRMVEQGHWKVDCDGVIGGIDKFQEVDRSMNIARTYTADLHW